MNRTKNEIIQHFENHCDSTIDADSKIFMRLCLELLCNIRDNVETIKQNSYR